MDKYLGRPVKQFHSFEESGTFNSYYKALKWLSDNGYKYGSTSIGNPMPVMKDKYEIHQKWYNLTEGQRKNVDGVVISDDWREGEVKVILF
jgi:hypothetical protein